FGCMASGGAASLGRDAKVAWIDELDVFGGLLQPFCVNIFGNRGAIFENWIARLDVSFYFCGFVVGRSRISSNRNGNRGVAAVAVGAGEGHGFCGVHRGFVCWAVAGNASRGFAGAFGFSLPSPRQDLIAGLLTV